MSFNVEEFLSTLILDDATTAISYGSAYLDEKEMGKTLTYSSGVLTVEESDGTLRHFRIQFTEITKEL